jgi:LacI family transcriptional regulator
VIDVARLAGVGKTTVSAVVHGREHVAPELRERVLHAIEQLSYRPNVSARNLKLQRTDVIGVAAGDLLDPFNAEITAYIERRAAHYGLKMLLVTSGLDGARTGAVRSLLGHPVAAVIFIGAAVPSEIEQLADPHVPFIFISRENELGPSLVVDNMRGGDLATSHLIALGHRRLAYVSVGFGPMSAQEDRARLAGFRRALKRSSGAIASQQVVRLRSPSPGKQREALTTLLTEREASTGIFAASDRTALELIQRGHELGLHVPRDISIIGFDNIAIAAYSSVALTTVAQPIEELATRAVDIVVAAMAGTPLPPVLRFEPVLIVRSSTAKPRATAG